MKFDKIIPVLEILNKFASRSTQIHDIRELALEVEHILEEVIEMEYTGLFLYDFVEKKLKLYFAKGFSEEERVEAERTVMDRHPGHVYKSGKTLYVPDVDSFNPPFSIDSKRSFKIRTRLSIPVFNGDNVVGVFSIASSKKNNFSEEQIAVFSFIGNIAGSVYGHILNQSELESSTSRITTLIQNMQTGIMMEDENRKIVLVNNEYCNLFDISDDPEQMVGMDLGSHIRYTSSFFKEPEKFLDKVRKILAFREPVIDETIELADGRVYERDYLPIYSRSKFMGNLWQYSDITARKKAERDLKNARQDAISANIAKSQFLANMSHEIRTPLNAIYGLTRLLEDTQVTEEQRKLITGLNSSSEGLLGIVNDILDFSKIEAGQMDLNESEFSLEELVKKVYDSFEFRAEENEVKLKIIFDKEIKFHLFGDKVRLRQILVNLMNNAIKFTQKGIVKLECSLVKSTRNSCVIYFSVSDTGIGIAKEDISKIFQSFQQLDPGTTRNYGGTGLGLPISRQLVELMGGILEVNSMKNKGSEFYFTLPFKKAFEAVKPVVVESIELNIKSLNGIKALIVEDNQFNQFIAKSMLEKWNMVVTVANNGREALDRLRDYSFQIVLMDLQMPEMGGLEATRKIRSELNLDIPVIALTANAVKGVIEECLSAGMNDYIPKPFNPETLANKIKHLLDSPIR